MPLTSSASLCEVFQHTAGLDPDAVALRTPGDVVSISWREYAAQVRRIAGGLAALGVRPGDTVALMMMNRPAFNLVDTAVLHLGATPPLRALLGFDQLEWAVAGAAAIAPETQEFLLAVGIKVAEVWGAS